METGIRDVQGIRGKTEEMARELRQIKLDIAAKKKGQDIKQVGEYIHIYSGIPKDQKDKEDYFYL